MGITSKMTLSKQKMKGTGGRGGIKQLVTNGNPKTKWPAIGSPGQAGSVFAGTRGGWPVWDFSHLAPGRVHGLTNDKACSVAVGAGRGDNAGYGALTYVKGVIYNGAGDDISMVTAGGGDPNKLLYCEYVGNRGHYWVEENQMR